MPGDPLLGRLMAGAAGQAAVYVSVYVDLDAASFATPRGRRAQVESLADEAWRQFTDSEQHRSVEQHQDTLPQDIERARRYLEAFRSEGARAVALFCSSSAGLFEAVRLARSVRPAMRIGGHPWLKPLIAAQPECFDWAVFAVSKEDAHLFVSSYGTLCEVPRFGGRRRLAGPGHTDPAGHPPVEEQVRQHVDAACGALSDRSAREPIRRLIVAMPKELEPTVMTSLRPAQKEHLIGHLLTAEVEELSPGRLAPEARRLVEEDRTRGEVDALSRLREALSRGEGAAAGLLAVLNVLNEQRAGELVMAAGFESGGAQCPFCHRLYMKGVRCAFDDANLSAVDDLAEVMVEMAIAQAASVHVVEQDTLSDLGGVAAVARYEAGG